MGRKKIQLKPKSNLGMNRELPMCYNCVFWQKDGWCTWYEDHYDYNHQCKSRKFFRYSLDLPYKNNYY